MIDYVTEAKRAKSAKSGRKPAAVWRIENEFVTYKEIAERLGIKKDAASSRMLRLKGATGAITWARLRAIGQ